MPSLRQVIGIPDSSASPLDSTLIIIDAQDEYKYGPLTAADYKEVNVPLSKLVDQYRQQNGKIIHVVHDTGIDQAPIFSPGGKLSKEMDEIVARPGEAIVKKKHAGSFSETDLQSVLLQHGVKKVVLTGYMAHGCVSSTAREATTLGYEVLIVEDAIGQRDLGSVKAADVKKVAMAEMNDMFGTVVKSDAILG
ncbi:hypothetical protein KC360_g9039 [Hortaea werneckii]|nr:hypothetical protein KC361_g8025 [Hortaea werneckii]KAI6877774.1 hypothetical protein KC325_g9043 [Hortaea werneckii]KAI6985419.1 hypothetical protein KC359_g9154 [Hortaea werneckii]KAI7139961.1 hypothetical protein KC344_g9037 [Hortaea werneckii]KAI7166772.1 hypothetical protein KC360_g9039 [Hortaea werneckii]